MLGTAADRVYPVVLTDRERLCSAQPILKPVHGTGFIIQRLAVTRATIVEEVRALSRPSHSLREATGAGATSALAIRSSLSA